MGILLVNLRPMYREMRQRELARVRFDYVFRRVKFDVFFFIDDSPYTLLFGVRAHNLAFEIAVRDGFIADTRIDEHSYKRLCGALELRFDPSNTFSPRAFLQEFDKNIPASLPPDHEPRPHELAHYRTDVDRSDGTYFCGWRDNTARNERVSERNLHKTLRLLGKRAHDACLRKNVSSCWTNNPEDPRIRQAAELPS